MNFEADEGRSDMRPGARRLLRRTNRADLRRILELAQPHRLTIGLAMLLLLSHAALGLALPWLLANVLDEVLQGTISQSWLQLDHFVLSLLALFFLRAGLSIAFTILLAQVGGRIVLELRHRLYTKLLAFEVAFHDEASVGAMVSRIMSDITKVQGLVTHDLGSLLSNSLVILGAGALMFWYGPWLSLLVLAALLPLTLIAWAYGRRMRELGRQVQTENAGLSAMAEERLNAVRLVQTYRREAFESNRFHERADGLYQVVMQRVRFQAWIGSAVSFLGSAALVLGLWRGGHAVGAGTMSTGSLFSYLLYAGMLANAISRLIGLYGTWSNALGASERVFEWLDRVPRIPLASPGGAPTQASAPTQEAAAVSIEKLSFSYGRGTRAALREINLEIAAGETLALVGASGAGKSTLLHLIARFYDPDEGCIKLDGVDLRDLSLSDLRGRLALVAQQPRLFDASAADNIRYGNLEADMDAIIRAAQHAEAHDFIQALPQGYETSLGARGERLSVGQQQRVAIARALIKEPGLLLLDEATSNLDSESELRIKRALAHLMQDRTSIVIAHRLSTVVDADRIVVLHEGRIVETGTHRELMEAGQRYRHLFEIQFQNGLK